MVRNYPKKNYRRRFGFIQLGKGDWYHYSRDCKAKFYLTFESSLRNSPEGSWVLTFYCNNGFSGGITRHIQGDFRELAKNCEDYYWDEYQMD